MLQNKLTIRILYTYYREEGGASEHRPEPRADMRARGPVSRRARLGRWSLISRSARCGSEPSPMTGCGAAFAKTLTRKISQPRALENSRHAPRKETGITRDQSTSVARPALLAKVRQSAATAYLYAQPRRSAHPEKNWSTRACGQSEVQCDIQLSNATWPVYRPPWRWLVDVGGDHESDPDLTLAHTGPYAARCSRVQEESFQQRQGYEIMMKLAQWQPRARDMEKEATEPLVVWPAHDVRPSRLREPRTPRVDPLEKIKRFRLE